MAARYWVGGAGNWDTTTTHWSTSSGGASGASVPGSGNDVFFDANSGGGTVALVGNGFNTIASGNVDTTGFGGVLDANGGASTWDVNGTTFTLAASTISGTGVTINFKGGATQLTTNGNTLPGISLTSPCAITLQDSLTFSAAFSVSTTPSSFDANGHDVTQVGSSSFQGGAGFTLTLGSGTWAVGNWDFASATVNPDTATIKIHGGVFRGGSSTYPLIWATTGVTFSGSNYCTTLKVDALGSLLGTNTSTTTFDVADFGKGIYIDTNTGSGSWTLSCASGEVNVDDAEIYNNTGSGGALFNAFNSLDGGNNSGWIFGERPFPIFFGAGA